jgi:hypothetical protein
VVSWVKEPVMVTPEVVVMSMTVTVPAAQGPRFSIPDRSR